MQPPKPGLLSIVIVNWNTRDLLLSCIQSIYDTIHGLDYEILVVDNASSDGSAEAVKYHFPGAKLILSSQNLGFARGNNLAIREANGEWLLLLNPDTILHSGSVERMLYFLREHPETGIIGPMLTGKDGKPQISSFGLFPCPLETMLRTSRVWKWAPKSRLARRFLVRPDSPGSWTYTAHLLGACMLVRREVIQQTGGFDEGFFLFLEETDLCFRTRQQGWQIVYYTGAEITHLGEQSMQNILHRTGGYYMRSYNRYCRKHGMRLHSRLLANVFLTAGILAEAAIGLIKHRNPKRALNSLSALWYGYISQP